MNARAVNALSGVIHAAMRTHSTAAGIAMAVDAAGMLMSPEVAAELVALRAAAEAMPGLDEVRALAFRAANRPFLFSDCEGVLRVWALSALTHVIRNEAGVITSWSEPGSYTSADLVAEVELDMGTWDPGEDVDDDQRRQDVGDLVTAREGLPALLAEVDRLRAERHSTNEALSEAAEALRTKDARIAELEAELRIGPPWKCHVCGKDNRRDPCVICETYRPDADEASPATGRVVAYRSESGRTLRCVDCTPVDLTGFVPVTSADLPDGGICTHPECGRDVLITPAGGGPRG